VARRPLRPRPVPRANAVSVRRLERFLSDRFPRVPWPVRSVYRARKLGNGGFAADVALFDGDRCVLIVRTKKGRKRDERWYMRTEPDGFYFSISRHAWVRASDEEAEEAIAAQDCR
jgi:hypothetical protein